MKRVIKSTTQINRQVTDWRTLKVGDKLIMICDEFDGYSETPCTVSEVSDTHAIATEDCEVGRPMNLWIDDRMQDLFVYANTSMLASIDSDTTSNHYTFYFGDGAGARSRGTEVDSKDEMHAYLSSDLIALIAGNVLTDLYYGGMSDGFTEDELHQFVLDEFILDEDEWDEAFSANDVNAWAEKLESKDISDGSVMVYKIVKNGSDVIYHNPDIEEYIEELEDVDTDD